jgi:hypothetical protein
MGTTAEGAPVFSCTILAESIELASKAIRCSRFEWLRESMTFGAWRRAAVHFGSCPFVEVRPFFTETLVLAIANQTYKSVKNVNYCQIRQVVQKSAYLFLGETPDT